MLDIEYTTIEEGMEKLKKNIETRNQMGGALYWNICNDDCIKLARSLINAGVDMKEVALLGVVPW